MKLKGWLGASLVLILALAGTLLLSYYWESVRKASFHTLQERVNDIELERVVERGGQRLYKQSQEIAARFEKAIDKIQKEAELLADTKALRLPNSALSQKKAAFQKRAKKRTNWNQAFLTNSSGKILAAKGTRQSITMIPAADTFKLVKTQRFTVIELNRTNGKKSYLQVTVPCISDKSKFLGVLQVLVEWSPQQLKKISAQSSIVTLLSKKNGDIIFSSDKDIKPKNIINLIGKPTDDVNSIFDKNGPIYFQARWKSKNYILAGTNTAFSDIKILTMLVVTGFKKAIAPQAKMGSFLTDPVVMGGYTVLFIICIFLLMFMSGGSNEGVSKMNQQLADITAEGAALKTLKAPGKGEIEKLADYINILIDRMKLLSTQMDNDSSENADANVALTSEQLAEIDELKNELTNLKNQVEQAETEKEALQQQRDSIEQEKQNQIDELVKQSEELNQSLSSAQSQAASAAPALPAVDRSIIEKLQQSGNLRIEAITNMSEDLKATLLVIKNYISSILSSDEGSITDAQQEFLGDVINKSARLERQINDLLDISHMESEGTNWYTEPTDIVAMLQDVVLNIQPQADTKQIKIIPEIQTPLPLIKINSDRMGQVFINLVQHAIKITTFGGEVKISAAETLSDIVIKVRDGGSALLQDQADQVFTVFNGQDALAGVDYSGTGLRFPIIRQIVELHHGSMTMRGLPEIGNEAVISFPKSAVVDENAEPSTTTFTSTDFQIPAEASEVVPIETQAEAPAESTEENVLNPMDVYEVKSADNAAKKEEPKEETSPYDLSAFMGAMDDSPEEDKSGVPGAGEDLDVLLKDIEDIDDQMI